MNTKVGTAIYLFSVYSGRSVSGSEKRSFAKIVNSIRRELLEETRTSGMVEQFDYSATSSEYESKLQQLFHAKLDSKC